MGDLSLIKLKLADDENALRVLHIDDAAYYLKVSKQILEMEGKFESARKSHRVFSRLQTSRRCKTLRNKVRQDSA